MRWNQPLVVTLLAVSLGAVALRQAVVDETFAGYDSKPLTGQPAKGAGLSGAWIADADTKFSVKDGRLVIPGDGRELSVKLAQPITLRPGQELFVSFTARALTATTQDAQGFIQFASGQTSVYAVGHIWGQEYISQLFGSPSTTPVDTKERKYLLHIVAQEKGARVSVVFDPDPGLEASQLSPIMTGWPEGIEGVFTFDHLRFKANANEWHFDNIRIGNTLDDVNPLK